MQQDDLTVLVENTKIKVPPKFAQVSAYINGLMALSFGEEEEIEVFHISKSTFTQILEFYQLCDYEDVPIKTPIKSNNIEDVMHSKFAEFIERHPIKSEQFKNLYKGAEFLGCKNLLRACAARFSCMLYFEDNYESFELKQKELGVEVNIEFQDNQKFKKLYPFMNN